MLVIGNATVDEIYAVSALPKPGESVLGSIRLRDVGGKGANVAMILARCGLSTCLLSTVGKDERGDFVQRELSDEPLELDLVVSTTRPTDVSLVYTDARGDNAIVTTVDAAHSLELSRVQRSLDRLQNGGMLVLQANLPEALTRFVASYAKTLDLTIVFNPSPYAEWVKDIIHDATVVFVNEEESYALTGSCDESSVLGMLEQGPDQVVITRGNKAVLLGSRAHSGCNGGTANVISFPVSAEHVVDTTGAGDTFLAVTMASACLRACPVDTTALGHAALAAAITISSHGARSAFPRQSELAHILSCQPPES